MLGLSFVRNVCRGLERKGESGGKCSTIDDESQISETWVGVQCHAGIVDDDWGEGLQL